MDVGFAGHSVLDWTCGDLSESLPDGLVVALFCLQQFMRSIDRYVCFLESPVSEDNRLVHHIRTRDTAGKAIRAGVIGLERLLLVCPSVKCCSDRGGRYRH